MANPKFLTQDGLLYVWQKIKVLLNGKVDKIDGKALSTNDYTTEDMIKLASIEAGADENVLEAVKVNGVALTITNKAVDVSVPTNNNQLTNGAGYQTASDVSTAINTALADVISIRYRVVDSLPATGEAGVIYLVAHSHGTQDVYDEYIYVDNKFEKIGNTDIDLSSYVQVTDIIANNDIDTIFAS